MSVSDLDHLIIHIDDWDAEHEFYVEVLGLERVESPEGAGNPLGAWVYRLGGQQTNVHGPWRGRTDPFCPPPLTLSEDDFVPSSAQLAGAAVAVTTLVALAALLARTPPRRRPRSAGDGGAPAEMPPELARSGQAPAPAGASPEPRRVAAAAAGATLLFFAGAAQMGSALAVVAVYLVLVAWGVTAVRRWSARPGWSARHRLALAAGALVPHLAFAVAQRSLVEVPLWLDLLGDLIFISCTAALVLAGWRAVGRPASP